MLVCVLVDRSLHPQHTIIRATNSPTTTRTALTYNTTLDNNEPPANCKELLKFVAFFLFLQKNEDGIDFYNTQRTSLRTRCWCQANLPLTGHKII